MLNVESEARLFVSQHERTGTRDLAYSKWHRWSSTARFIGEAAAKALAMIDIDDCEYCNRCGAPLGFVETAFDNGRHKATTVTRLLAERCGLPAYLAYYTKTDDGDDISSFRVAELFPQRTFPSAMTPEEYCRKLQRLRDEHFCPGTLFAGVREERVRRGL